MGAKMKGLLKGLRHISQVFDDDKESEIQIGYPTDVKHVGHIGWDGPSSVESPSWMKDLKQPTRYSAPLDAPPREAKENPEVKWVSQDSSQKVRRHRDYSSKDKSQKPKSSARRRPSTENALSVDSGSEDTSSSSTKPRQSRRDQNKDPSEKLSRQFQVQASGVGLESNPDPRIPKKSRRKKVRDMVKGKSNRGSGSKASSNNNHSCSSTAFKFTFSDDESCGGANISEESNTNDPLKLQV